jgi:hypothetical protein
MLLVTQLIAFWFYLQMADERVLYRPRWLAEGQRLAWIRQVNSKQTVKSDSQSIINGIVPSVNKRLSLPSINNGMLHPKYDPRYLTNFSSQV